MIPEAEACSCSFHTAMRSMGTYEKHFRLYLKVNGRSVCFCWTSTREADRLGRKSDKLVLTEDANHPLSQAFGSRAAFALEVGWILAHAVQYSRDINKDISHTLERVDSIRSPYHASM